MSVDGSDVREPAIEMGLRVVDHRVVALIEREAVLAARVVGRDLHGLEGDGRGRDLVRVENTPHLVEEVVSLKKAQVDRVAVNGLARAANWIRPVKVVVAENRCTGPGADEDLLFDRTAVPMAPNGESEGRHSIALRQNDEPVALDSLDFDAS